MVDLLQDLKHRARHLQQRAQQGQADALAFLTRVPALAQEPAEVRAAKVQRRHCLTAIGRALGFSGWPHARSVVAGESVHDFGTLMHRESGGAYWNIWSARYDEASTIRREHGGYLLAYRRQFLIVEAPFVQWLGIDPADADWAHIGRDWARPADRTAWSRLTLRAIDRRLARLVTARGGGDPARLA